MTSIVLGYRRNLRSTISQKSQLICCEQIVQAKYSLRIGRVHFNRFFPYDTSSGEPSHNWEVPVRGRNFMCLVFLLTDKLEVAPILRVLPFQETRFTHRDLILNANSFMVLFLTNLHVIKLS